MTPEEKEEVITYVIRVEYGDHPSSYALSCADNFREGKTSLGEFIFAMSTVIR